MSRPVKVLLGPDVLTAARERIAWVFDTFPRIYVSFSGGKDSTILLHLVAAEARRRGRKFGLLFIDWEAQFRLTIEHVTALFAEYADCTDPYWVALPLRTVNACSQFEPEWICWAPEKRERWVREMPAHAISAPAALPCYSERMSFEEFAPAFGHWYAQGQLTCCFLGLRAGESLNRWRTIAGHGTKFEGRNWTNYTGQTTYNASPIYDWSVEDIWTYHGRHGGAYNLLYDRMHQAGLTPSQMRVDEPYGVEARRGIWLFHVIEPETWGRVVDRVAGAASGAEYAGEPGAILGNRTISKPAAHTWHSYVEFLLDSMPSATSEHYRNKIAVWCNWWRTKGSRDIADELPGDMGATDLPSWRRVARVILRHDFWCKGLCFSPTKTAAFSKYQRIMENRRRTWKLPAFLTAR